MREKSDDQPAAKSSRKDSFVASDDDLDGTSDSKKQKKSDKMALQKMVDLALASDAEEGGVASDAEEGGEEVVVEDVQEEEEEVNKEKVTDEEATEVEKNKENSDELVDLVVKVVVEQEKMLQLLWSRRRLQML